MGKSFYIHQGQRMGATEIENDFEELKKIVFPGLQSLLKKYGISFGSVKIGEILGVD